MKKVDSKIRSVSYTHLASRKTGDITTRFSDAFTIKDIFTNIALSLIMDISMAPVSYTHLDVYKRQI